MSYNITSLIKLDTVHLYLDNKNILYFDILSSLYSKSDSITILEYFKNFWILAKEQLKKYYLVVKINYLGVYPISFYSNLVVCLNSLNSIFKDHLHCCIFLCNDKSLMHVLKPLFNIYKFVRPFKICLTLDDVFVKIKTPEYNLLN